jgi:hypothetical protein
MSTYLPYKDYQKLTPSQQKEYDYRFKERVAVTNVMPWLVCIFAFSVVVSHAAVVEYEATGNYGQFTTAAGLLMYVTFTVVIVACILWFGDLYYFLVQRREYRAWREYNKLN